jgi:hypothetical protein
VQARHRRGVFFTQPVASTLERQRRLIGNSVVGINRRDQGADHTGWHRNASRVAREMHIHARAWSKRAGSLDSRARRTDVEEDNVVTAADAGGNRVHVSRR